MFSVSAVFTLMVSHCRSMNCSVDEESVSLSKNDSINENDCVVVESMENDCAAFQQELQHKVIQHRIKTQTTPHDTTHMSPMQQFDD